MSLTVTVTRGYTMVAGVKPSVDDWNAGFLPSITVSGSVGASDIADDSITFAMLNPNVFLGGTTATSISSADLIPFGDVSVGDNRVITFQNFLKSIALECTARTAFNAFSDDTVLYWEADDTLPVTMTIARFFEQAMVQPYDLTTTSNDDTVMVRDDSETAGAQVKKVRLDNLLPDVITEQTVNNPTQVVVNSKGQIVGLSGSAGGTDAVAWLRDTGASGTDPLSVTGGAATKVRLTDTSTVTWLALATDTFTVQPGTYEIDAVVPWSWAGAANAVVVYLYDETATANVATTTLALGSDDDFGFIPLKAVFTVSVETDLSLRILSAENIVLGVKASVVGYDETFSQVLLRRLATA